MTQEETRQLSKSNREEGWAAIPPTAPEHVRLKICEWRKGVLDGTICKRGNQTDASRMKKAEALLKEIELESVADAEALLRLRAEAATYIL